MKKLQKKLTKNEGFTLLEILVVLTIMGFLIAMVGPMLANLSTEAGGTVCDTNKGRGRDYIAGFYEKYDRYPNKLTNIVIDDASLAMLAASKFQIPPCDDKDPDTGAEVIRFGQNKAFRFIVHHLNSAEAAELKGLGLTTLINLNDYSGLTPNGVGFDGADGADPGGGQRLSNWVDIAAIATQAPSREIADIQTGLGVAMSGCGCTDPAVNDFTYTSQEREWGMDETFGRIVFSIGPESELVTKGMISSAGHSPGGIRYDDLYTFNEYYVILPRLEATSDRLLATAASFAPAFGPTGLTAAILQDTTKVIWEKGDGPASGYDFSTNPDLYSVRSNIDLTRPMEPWEFAKQRNQNDVKYGYNLNGNTTLQ